MRLRRARPEDAAGICAIANPIIRDTLVTFTTVLRRPEEVAAQIVERGSGFLVAEAGTRIVGFASYGRFRAGPGYRHSAEHSINLDPAARGQGLGRRLMSRLEAEAAAAGIHVLVAGISGANPGAIGFHQRLGYAEVGRLPEVGFKAGQWLDLVLMQKILPAAARPADRPGGGG